MNTGLSISDGASFLLVLFCACLACSCNCVSGKCRGDVHTLTWRGFDGTPFRRRVQFDEKRLDGAEWPETYEHVFLEVDPRAEFILDGVSCGKGREGYEQVLKSAERLSGGETLVIYPYYELLSDRGDASLGMPFSRAEEERLKQVAAARGLAIERRAGPPDGGAAE